VKTLEQHPPKIKIYVTAQRGNPIRQIAVNLDGRLAPRASIRRPKSPAPIHHSLTTRSRCRIPVQTQHQESILVSPFPPLPRLAFVARIAPNPNVFFPSRAHTLQRWRAFTTCKGNSATRSPAEGRRPLASTAFVFTPGVHFRGLHELARTPVSRAYNHHTLARFHVE